MLSHRLTTRSAGVRSVFAGLIKPRTIPLVRPRKCSRVGISFLSTSVNREGTDAVTKPIWQRLSRCVFCALQNKAVETENPSCSVCFNVNRFHCFRCGCSGSLQQYEDAIQQSPHLSKHIRAEYDSLKHRFKNRSGTEQHGSTRQFSTQPLARPSIYSGAGNAQSANPERLSPDIVMQLEQPHRNLQQQWPEMQAAGAQPPAAIKFLQNRGLKRETCMLYKVGTMQMDVYKGGIKEMVDVVTFPFYHRYGEFDPAAVRTVVSHGEYAIQRFKARGCADKTVMRSFPRGQNAQTFFGWQTIPSRAREIVITEGEIDAMTVYQETGIPAVSVPNGASSFPDSLVHALAKIDKVVLWYDDDLAGREGCEKAIAKLTERYGYGKCLVVRPSEAERLAARRPPRTPEGIKTIENSQLAPVENDLVLHVDGTSGIVKDESDNGTIAVQPDKQPKDANDFLLQGYDIRRLLQTKKPLKHEKIITPAEMFNEVRELFLNPVARKGKQFTGFPTLNLLLGGFRPGELTLVSGPTGSGKTTLLSQVSLDLCMAGVPTLWGSFEIDVTRLQHTMMNQFVYRTFYGEWTTQQERSTSYPDLKLENVFRSYFSSFSDLPMSFMNFFGSTDIEQVMKVMVHHVESQDVQHIIIDNLQYMVSGSGAEKDWKPKSHMYSAFNKFEAMERALDYFRAFATNRKVHVSVVIHPKKVNEFAPLTLDSIMGTAKATQEADNVICIQRLMDCRKTLDLKKNRFDGKLGRMDITFDPEHKCFFDGGIHVESQQNPSAYFSRDSSNNQYGYRSPSSGSFLSSGDLDAGFPLPPSADEIELVKDSVAPVKTFSPAIPIGSHEKNPNDAKTTEIIPLINLRFSANEDAALIEATADAIDGSEHVVFERVREDFLPHRSVEDLMARFKQLRSSPRDIEA